MLLRRCRSSALGLYPTHFDVSPCRSQGKVSIVVRTNRKATCKRIARSFAMLFRQADRMHQIERPDDAKLSPSELFPVDSFSGITRDAPSAEPECSGDAAIEAAAPKPRLERQHDTSPTERAYLTFGAARAGRNAARCQIVLDEHGREVIGGIAEINERAIVSCSSGAISSAFRLVSSYRQIPSRNPWSDHPGKVSIRQAINRATFNLSWVTLARHLAEHSRLTRW